MKRCLISFLSISPFWCFWRQLADLNRKEER